MSGDTVVVEGGIELMTVGTPEFGVPVGEIVRDVTDRLANSVLLPVDVATDETIDVSAPDVRGSDVAASAALDRVVVEALVGFASELT